MYGTSRISSICSCSDLVFQKEPPQPYAAREAMIPEIDHTRNPSGVVDPFLSTSFPPISIVLELLVPAGGRSGLELCCPGEAADRFVRDPESDSTPPPIPAPLKGP